MGVSVPIEGLCVVGLGASVMRGDICVDGPGLRPSPICHSLPSDLCG